MQKRAWKEWLRNRAKSQKMPYLMCALPGWPGIHSSCAWTSELYKTDPPTSQLWMGEKLTGPTTCCWTTGNWQLLGEGCTYWWIHQTLRCSKTHDHRQPWFNSKRHKMKQNFKHMMRRFVRKKGPWKWWERSERDREWPYCTTYMWNCQRTKFIINNETVPSTFSFPTLLGRFNPIKSRAQRLPSLLCLL